MDHFASMLMLIPGGYEWIFIILIIVGKDDESLKKDIDAAIKRDKEYNI